MNRRIVVSLFKGSIAAVLLLCLGCSAQSPTSDVDRRIEKQVRVLYEDRLPSDVQITVSDRKNSEIPNYDQVTVSFSQGNSQPQTQEFLVSKDGKTLARFAKWDITKDPYAEVMSKINTAGRPYKGNKDAKVVVVNYDDFQCPFCSRMHQTMNVIMKQYGDRVKLVYKDFPLTEIHPWAMRAAVAGNCLAAQNNDAYWQFADYLHANGQAISGQKRDVAEANANVDKAAREQATKMNLDVAKLNACLAKPDEESVRASMTEAMQLGVQATPTLFINGERIGGALPAREVEAVIQRALRDAGEPVPATEKAEAPKPGIK